MGVFSLSLPSPSGKALLCLFHGFPLGGGFALPRSWLPLRGRCRRQPTEEVKPRQILSRRFAPLSPQGKARARDDETAMCKTPKLQRTLEASKTRSVRISRRALTDSKQPSENANATQYCAAYNARIVTTIRGRSTTPYPTPTYRSTAFRNPLCGIFPQALRSGSRCRVPGRPAPA